MSRSSSPSQGRSRSPTAAAVDDDASYCDDEAEEVTETNAPVTSLRIWRVVPKKLDNRRKWKVAFENNEVPYGVDFEGSTQSERWFGVGIKWGVLEKWCQDIPVSRPEGGGELGKMKATFQHQQRATWFPKLSSAIILDEAYKSVCAQHPATTELDGTKWAKFIREIELFPENMKRTANNVSNS